MGDHIEKESRRTKLIFTFYITHTPQKCHFNVIRDTLMLQKDNRVNFYFILP